VDDGMRQHHFSLIVLDEVSVAGSGDHGEDPGLTCHKVLVSSLAGVYFISSKSILIHKGVLTNLGMAVMTPKWRRSTVVPFDIEKVVEPMRS
jgi:hypothetical protein